MPQQLQLQLAGQVVKQFFWGSLGDDLNGDIILSELERIRRRCK